MAVTLRREDIQTAANFLQELLAEHTPDGDFRPGTAVYDLVVKAYATIFAFLTKEIDTVRARQSILEILSIPQDSPLYTNDVTQALDALMSNWFLTRKSGVRVAGTVGVRFTFRDASLLIRKGHRFFLGGDPEKIYQAITDHTFEYNSTKNDYKTIASPTGAGSVYEVSVAVESSGLGSTFLPDNTQSSLFTFDPINSFAFQAIQVGDFLGGADAETNEEFVDRAKQAITKRDLSTFKSISTLLLDTFSFLDSVEVVGYGDSEMQRDRLREKNRYLVVNTDTTMPSEESITDEVKLCLRFNERFGRNYPKDSTDIWGYNDFLFQENDPPVSGFSSSTSQWVDGHLGGGLFLEPNQCIKLSYADQALQGHPFAENTLGNFTISMWVNGRPSNLNTTARILHTGFNANPKSGVIEITVDNDGYVGFYLRTPDGDETVSSTRNTSGTVNKIKAGTVEDPGFSWVVATYLGDNILLYIDNILQDVIQTAGRATEYGDLFIGGSSNPDNAYSFTGVVDNIVFYSNGKNDVELDEIYDRQSGGFPQIVNYDIANTESVLAAPGLQFDEHFHVGGRVDVYSKTPLHKFKPLKISGIYQPTVNTEDGYTTITVPIPAEPFYRLYFKTGEGESIVRTPLYNNTGEVVLDVVDENIYEDDIVMQYTISVEDPLLLHSQRQNVNLTLLVNDPTFTLDISFIESSFEYDTVTSFSTLETYVNNRENRITCGDLLIKGFFPVYVKAHIEYTLKSGVLSIDETAMVQSIVSFINDLAPGDILEASDLIAMIYSNFGVGRINLPLELLARFYMPDNQSFEITSQNSLPVPSLSDITEVITLDPVLAEVLSQRTVRYIATTEDITVAKVNL